MAGFNGSGTYVREYDWTEDAANGVDIEASRMDTEMDAMATALSTCITKDGQTTITGNLPMANFRHTGVGDASARTHYGKVGQIQDGTYLFAGFTGGSATAYTATLSPSITAYVYGMRIIAHMHTANTTTTPTINFNSVGAKTIKAAGGGAVAVGDVAGVCTFTYDGTFFQLSETLRQVATQAQMEASTSAVVLVTPSNIVWSPYAAKVFGWIAISGGSPSLSQNSGGISSITDLGAGAFRINLAFGFSTAGYAPVVTPEMGSGTQLCVRIASKTTTSFECIFETPAGVATDPLGFSVVCFGDL